MSGALLLKYQTETASAAAAAETSRGRYDEAKDGADERQDEPRHADEQRQQRQRQTHASCPAAATTTSYQ
jgi:hypothetical protein